MAETGERVATRELTALKKDASRTRKLAAALKDNLKRRKAQARARGEAQAGPEAKELGTAPQEGLEEKPQKGPNAAKNRE